MSNHREDSQADFLQNQNLRPVSHRKNKVAPERPSSTSKSSKEQKKQQEIEEVPFCQMFRFATTFDIVLMVIGTIASMILGAALPVFALLWGQMTNAFVDPLKMVDSAKEMMLVFIYIGIGAFFIAWVMFSCWMIAGERQGIACRKAYLRSLLQQQIGWFDITNQMQLSSKFATDSFAFQGALGQKLSTIIMSISMLISGFVIAFVTGWLMTLVTLSLVPGLIIAGIAYMASISSKQENEQKKYSKAAGRAEQALSSIKTVKQLNGEKFELSEYEKCLEDASADNCKYGLYSGLGMGALFFVMFASYGLGFWYGSKCVVGSEECPESVSGQKYEPGDVLIIFMSVLMAGFNLSQFGPALQKISQGKQAAKRIYKIIDRKPEIFNPINGKKIEKLKGEIRFQNVTFAYPKDKSNKILSNLTLDLSQNTIGLVGQSGCGKSTIMQLLLRFYDPDEGKITLDGIDLRELDLEWLRRQFGYVGQQPVLFATTIKENLLFGNEASSDNEIEKALKMAEAYDFVQQLENKLQTYVGYGGNQLSGGQKQRIAIARAILRDPKILLLDEATSALDRRNQKLIQITLNKISEGKKTITIAHKVKTIVNCGEIFVFEKGRMLEQGKFSQLNWFKSHQHELEEEEKAEEKLQEKEASNKKQQVKNEKEDKEEDNKILKTKDDIEKQFVGELVKKYEDDIFSRIFSYSSKKIGLFLFGIFFALINGAVFPVFSLFFAKMLNSLLVLALQPNNLVEMANINFYALLFVILGVASFLLTALQNACMIVVGEDITKKIRVDVFNKMLKLPIAFFDIPRNNPGALSSRLSADCQKINAITTTTVSVMIQNVSSLICGVVIAFVFEWRSALVALGLLPLMIISGIIEMSFNTGFSDKTDAAYKESSSLIMESMINIRTVSSFGYQSIIANKFDEKMIEPYDLAVKKGNVSGLLFGFSQFIMYLIFGLLFFLGAIFVRDNDQVTIEDMFTAIYAIMFAGMSAGNNAHFMPDMAVCQSAAANLFLILDSEDEEQLQEKEESKMLKEGINGDIVLKDITFKYESRKQYLFEKLNMKIEHGTKVALVGTSGCGKSTILQMLQRFYMPEKGDIFINGNNIKDFDIHYLRKTFGVVSQEPVLFDGSFKYNIEYNQSEKTMKQIEEAAQKANALTFIKGEQKLLEDETEDNAGLQGFNRSVGVKGSHISGGQKQRVAIARVMIRSPDFLLLDEATSALDRQNEKKVQESIDSLMSGKTCVTVAHRIQTIKNAEKIYVFQRGQIVEEGSYDELMSKKGYFHKIEKGLEFI